jgi:hypothetical protein
MIFKAQNQMEIEQAAEEEKAAMAGAPPTLSSSSLAYFSTAGRKLVRVLLRHVHSLPILQIR